MVLPPIEDTKKLLDKLESLLKLVVDSIQTKNRVRVLLLVESVLLLVCNPFVSSKIFNSFNVARPTWYVKAWLISLFSIFALALVIALRAKKVPLIPNFEHNAIKGLRPFGYEDREIFLRLQRHEILRESLASILASEFRFGILCGESGSGKSSFARAGLIPKLLEKGYRCAYVKFSDLDPVDCISKALVRDLGLPKDKAEAESLTDLLKTTLELGISPVVLLFDQFEQFFLHYNNRRRRKPFIHQMRDWFQENTLPVKILICLRGDFADRMIEFQKAMLYTLGPQDSFRLERFDTDEATEVLRVIAESEGFAFEEEFVRKILAHELADREEGTVSPVDLQIFSWIVAGQRDAERAFNRSVYQKLGGVEGLLERFLKRALEALDPRENASIRQTAIKILVSLTDLERNASAGSLSIVEIREKIQPNVAPTEVEQAVVWLERNDVRLITRVERDRANLYELAHERLIPALRRLVGQELGEADKASQLLDRRVNEWIGNQRKWRYLLRWLELRLVNRNRALLEWGKQRKYKEQLLAHSKRRLKLLVSISIGIILVPSLSYCLWLSPWGQMWQTKRDLAVSSSTLLDGEVLTRMTIAFIAVDDFGLAQRTENRINDQAMTQAFPKIVDAYLKAGAADACLNFVQRCRARSSQNKTQTLMALAEACARAGNSSVESAVIAELLAEGDPRIRGAAIANFVNRYSQLALKQSDRRFLDKARQLSDKFDSERQDSLSTIALNYAHLGEKVRDTELLREALNIASQITDNDCLEDRVDVLAAVASAYTNLGEPIEAKKALSQAPSVAEAITDNVDKFDALVNVAGHYGTVGEIALGRNTLSRAFSLVTAFDDSDKVDALLSLAETYAGLGDISSSLTFMKPIAVFAETITDKGETSTSLEILPSGRRKRHPYPQSRPMNRTEVLGDMADTYVSMAIKGRAPDLFAEAIRVATSQGIKTRKEMLNQVADGYIQLAKVNGSVFLDQARTFTSELESSARVEALLKIAEAYIEAGDSATSHDVLRQSADYAESLDDRYFARSSLITRCKAIALKHGDREFLIEAHRSAQGIQASNREDVLMDIAIAYGMLGDSKTSLTVLDQTRFSEEQKTEYARSILLSGTSKVYSILGYWANARKTAGLLGNNSERSKALAFILLCWGDRRHPGMRELVVG